jgi:hypothetical protein
VIGKLYLRCFWIHCSPDFNPIEMAFAKLEALRRKAATRTVPRTSARRLPQPSGPAHSAK